MTENEERLLALCAAQVVVLRRLAGHALLGRDELGMDWTAERSANTLMRMADSMQEKLLAYTAEQGIGR